MVTTNNSNEKTMEEIKVTKMTLVAKNKTKKNKKKKHERAVEKKEHYLVSLS